MREKRNTLRNQLQREPLELEQRVRELEEELLRTEPKVFEITQSLPYEQRMIVEGFIYDTAELEMYTVIQAYKRGREQGEALGRKRRRLY